MMKQEKSRAAFEEAPMDPEDFDITDVWPNGLPEDALEAYGYMIRQGKITKRRVTLSRSSPRVVVEYSSALPRQWIHDELKRIRREGIPKEEAGTLQTSFA